YSVAVGFVALGLPQREAATGKLVYNYELWLANESNQRLTEVRSYDVNREYVPNSLYLLYANSLGGFDTLRCTGQSSRRLIVRGTDIQRALDPAYLPSSAELLKLNRRGDRTLMVATGLRDGADLDYLSEVLFSEQVFVVTQEGFVSLTLPTSGDAALDLRQDDEDLAGRLLTFQLGKTEIAYSALPAPPVSTARPTRWVPLDTFCLIGDQGVRTGQMGAVQLELRYVDDGSLVKPRRIKMNVPGTDGYQAPFASVACQLTPFLNVRVEQFGRFLRNNCEAGQEGGYATLVLEAGSIGAETAEQLAARVAAALSSLDTQAYANQYGPCLLNPKDYQATPPPGYFHFRTNLPDNLSVYYDGQPVAGNAWFLQPDLTNPNIYPYPKSNIALPIQASPALWKFALRAAFGGVGDVAVYRNGRLVRTEACPTNAGRGFDLPGAGQLVASGDRIYLELTNLRPI
ncbi:MAG: hypothetical protein EOP02_13260, partial [Proteobacteria bacterium]